LSTGVRQDGSSPIVAVLDSGIRSFHPDLRGRGMINYDAVTSENRFDDTLGHGTEVAGVIGATANNGIGISGVCPGCLLANVVIASSDGKVQLADAIEGVRYAADIGADVINASWSFDSPSSALAEAVQYAIDRGVVVVAAAGNSGNSSLRYPAALPGVIAVANTDWNDRLWSTSSYGAGWVDLAAPGSAVITTSIEPLETLDPSDNLYDYPSGTSFAAPMVAGVAALIDSRTPGLSPAGVEQLLKASADRIAGTGTQFEAGRLNARRAVNTAPVASAGPDQTVQRNQKIVLDASRSRDADGDAITFQWTQISGPETTIRGATSEKAEVDGQSRRMTLMYRVTVTDVWGGSRSDDIIVQVK
jgi:thermitase